MNYRTCFSQSRAAFRVIAFTASLTTACLLSLTIEAQQAPAAGNADDEIYHLSTFEVAAERDYGYQAISTLAGGRIATDLKDTPAAISIMTKEFMEDLGIDNVQDLALWSVSSESSDPGNSFSDDFQVSTRGLGNNVFGSRNYFRFYGNSDSYNVERLEFARGPNALLFGEASIGGISTTWTKQARLNRMIREIQFKVDAWGGYRGTIDYNHSKNNRFAFRVNALYADSPSWRDRVGQKQKDIHIATTVAITKTMQFRAEYQHSDKERWGAAFQPYTDQMTTWINNNGNIENPTVEGSAGWAQISGADLVWNAARPEDGILNWNGFYRSSGSGLVLGTSPRPGLLNSPVVPSREFNTSSVVGSTGDFKIDTGSVYLDKRFGKNVFAQIAYNYSKPKKTLAENRWNTTYLDLNKLLPNGEENPYYLQPYGEATLAGREQYNVLHEYRAMLAWSFQNSWTSQSFSLLVSRRLDEYSYSPTRYVPRGAKSYNGTEAIPYNSNSTTDAMKIRRYWSTLEPDTIPTHVTNPETGEILPMEYRIYSTTKEDITSDGIQISNVGKYLKGRLVIIAGYRYDRYEKDAWSTNTRNLDGTPATFNKSPPVSTTAHSPSIGGVYWLGNIGFSANYAKNFTPPTGGLPDINGNSLDPSKGEGYDFSIRFALGHKLTGSINYYKSTLIGGIGTPSNDNLYGQYMNNMWKAMGDTTRASVPTEFRDKSDSKGRGWELELVYNPTKNWRMRITGNIPEGFSSNQFKKTRAYISDNRAEWEAFIADETQDPQNRHEAAQNLINLDDRIYLDTRPGLKRSGMLKWKANFLTNYRIPSGVLRGLSIGGGMTYEGERRIDAVRNTNDGSFTYRYGEDRLLCNLVIKYEFRMLKSRASIQLNVNNLLDNDELDYRAINTSLVNGIRYYGRYNYTTPRSFSLTTKINF